MSFAMPIALGLLYSYIRLEMKRVDVKPSCRNNIILYGDNNTGPKEQNNEPQITF